MGRPAGDEQVPDLRTSGPMSSSDEQVRSCTLSPDSFTIPRPLPYSKVYGFGKNNDDSSEAAELLHSGPRGGGPDVGLRVPITTRSRPCPYPAVRHDAEACPRARCRCRWVMQPRGGSPDPLNQDQIQVDGELQPFGGCRRG